MIFSITSALSRTLRASLPSRHIEPARKPGTAAGHDVPKRIHHRDLALEEAAVQDFDKEPESIRIEPGNAHRIITPLGDGTPHLAIPL